MNKYETVIVMDSTITDEKRNKTINKFYNFIANNGTITNKEEMGKRKLAYTIKKHEYAYYYVIEYETKAENILELERLCRITDEVLKFMTVKKERNENL